jgi:hypothetical protein
LFNALLGTSIAFHYLYSPGPVAALAALTLVTGLLAGSYPALLSRGVRAGQVLKGECDARRRRGCVSPRARGAAVRDLDRPLIATGVVHEQTQFARNIDLRLRQGTAS